MKSITDLDVTGKRVLCRVDFNVPLSPEGRITDDARIRAVIPTLRYIIDGKGKLIVASHLGRPEGEGEGNMTLAPAAERLSELLGIPVTMAKDCIGPEVEALVAAMQPGQVILLENLRFHDEEKKNDDAFGKKLASLCDIYVNDAFAVSHRKNASVASVVAHAPVAVAGILLKRELDYFEKAMADPQRPLVAVVGGAKVSSKLAALTNMLKHVDKIIIGGAMANTFLAAKGFSMGASKIEDDLIETAEDMMREAADKGVMVYLPVDMVVASEFDENAVTKIVPIQEIPKDWMALDIGPATVSGLRPGPPGRQDRGLERPHGGLRDGSLQPGDHGHGDRHCQFPCPHHRGGRGYGFGPAHGRRDGQGELCFHRRRGFPDLA